ncbi:MAG: hypothetical protein AABW50_01310 [Nanoarchaeota archaeon]
MDKQLTIRIASNNELEEIARGNYLKVFSETVFKNMENINPLGSLQINGFSSKEHLRDFETVFLNKSKDNSYIKTETYKREADKLNLNHNTTINN